jgi:hypothetical protein
MKTSRAAKPLSPEQRTLLREVIEQRAPEMNLLNTKERKAICEAISTDFLYSGIGPDDEPLPRGLKLETLLDVINRPNLFPD